MTLQEYKERRMKDAEFVAAYAELQPELVEIAESIISETVLNDETVRKEKSRK